MLFFFWLEGVSDFLSFSNLFLCDFIVWLFIFYLMYYSHFSFWPNVIFAEVVPMTVFVLIVVFIFQSDASFLWIDIVPVLVDWLINIFAQEDQMVFPLFASHPFLVPIKHAFHQIVL